MSPQAVAVPHWSPDSAAPGTPALPWLSFTFEAETGPLTPPGTSVSQPLPCLGVAATASLMPSRLKSAVGIAEFLPGLEAYRRISLSFEYRFLPGHAVAKPSRWPEIVFSVACSPVFHTPVSSAAVSVTWPLGLPPYWPSFHAATRATDSRAARLGLPAAFAEWWRWRQRPRSRRGRRCPPSRR